MIEILLNSLTRAYLNSDLVVTQKLVFQLLSLTPIPRLEIGANVQIQRLRNNYNGELFTSEEEISYRRDPWNIKEFGRANFPYSSKFYGSLSSKYIDAIRVVNVLETNREFRDGKMDKKRQVFTSGEWVTIQPLKVAIFPFHKAAIIQNEEVESHARIFNSFVDKFPLEQSGMIKKVLKYVSFFYSNRNIHKHFDYLISAFVSEFIFDIYKLDGILYPSVRATYKTNNLVLDPQSVLSKLRLDKAAMFELFLNGKNAYIDNVAFAEISTDQ